MFGLSLFTFEEVWSPYFLFFVILLAIGYYYVNGPWRERNYPNERRASSQQQFYFMIGLILFYFVQGGPLELLGHLTFLFHMANMSISYLLVPPLILLGIPAYLWRHVFVRDQWRRVKVVMHPILTLVLFNMLFSFYHLPTVHDYVMTNYTVHTLYYFILLLTSFMMWWQVVDPLPEASRLTGVKKMAYIFTNGLLLTPACALIIFAETPLYAIYNDPNVWADAMGYCLSGSAADILSQYSGPDKFSILNPVEDQQAGGIIMKLMQEIMYGSILFYVFKQWYNKEHH